MKLLNNILLAVASALILAACSSSDDNAGKTQSDLNNRYINLSIAVTGGEDSGTRNTPVGGEDGDGREEGFERENAVTGITLILYEDAVGINSGSNPDITFVAYYPVSRVTKDADTRIEATYETGNQLVPHNAIDFTKTYHAIIVANANLTSSVTTGSKLNDVRDLTIANIYSGNATKPANSCGGFVMSSEQDNTLNFATGIKTQDAAGDYYYNMTEQPLVIERMAARIDFWSKNSNGYKTSAENAAYTIPGYEYNVTASSDKFVVTGIVPFNLANGHATYGNEYLIKRIRTDMADAATTSYLADETTTNYVIDPKTTTGKTGTESLTSSLENVYDLIGAGSNLENTTYNPYFHSVESMRVTGAMSTIESKENVVVAYPMENTLNASSKLYYYATGIAIVGYYYVNGTGTGTRYVYLGYLRHQGEADSYDIMPYTTPLATTDELGSSLAMKFGIVRNNIYRVWIGGIDQKGEMELKIKVKKWDPYTHSYIYM